MKNLTRKTVQGTAWVSTGYALQMLARLAVLAVLARLLTPGDFGVMAAAVLITGFGELLAPLGTGVALVRVAKLEPIHVKAAMTVSFASAAVLCPLLYLAGLLAEKSFGVPALGWAVLLLTPTLFFAGITQIASRMMQRTMRFGPLVIAEISAYLIGYGACGILLALLEWNYYALVAAHLIYSFCVAAILVWLTRPPLGFTENGAELRAVAGFGAKHTAANALEYAANNVPRLLILHGLNVNALGLYARASDLTNRLKTVITKVNSTVFYPAFAQRRDEPGKLNLAFLRSSFLILVAGLPCAILASILAERIIVFLFGGQWLGSIVPFQILIFALPPEAISAIASSILLTLGYPGRNSVANTIFLLSSLALCLALVSYGIAGIAAAVLLAVLFRFCVLMLFLQRHAGLTLAEVRRALSSKTFFFPQRSKPQA